MAFTPGGNDGTLSGTTPVTAAAAPASSTQRLVRTVTVYNADDAVAIVFLQLVNGANTRIIQRASIAVKGSVIWRDVFVLDDTSTSLELVMSAAANSVNPDFTASWADLS